MIGPTDITAIFGQRGSGKSEMARAISGLYPRLFVIDTIGEWKKRDADLVTDSFDSAANFLDRTIGGSEFRCVFQFDVDTKTDAQKKTFNALLRLLWKRGHITGENVCLNIEEVHEYCGAGWSEEWLKKCVMIGRHANMAMVVSSQRPAQVDKGIISQAHNVLVGHLHEPRDIEYIRQWSDALADQIPKLKKFKFVYRRENENFRIVDREDFK